MALGFARRRYSVTFLVKPGMSFTSGLALSRRPEPRSRLNSTELFPTLGMPTVGGPPSLGRGTGVGVGALESSHKSPRLCVRAYAP